MDVNTIITITITIIIIDNSISSPLALTYGLPYNNFQVAASYVLFSHFCVDTAKENKHDSKVIHCCREKCQKGRD